MTTQEIYSTMDAYLGGFLILRGFKSKAVNQGSKVVFTFQDSEALQEVISSYHQGAVVKANEYSSAVKAIKGQIHDLRRRERI